MVALLSNVAVRFERNCFIKLSLSLQLPLVSVSYGNLCAFVHSNDRFIDCGRSSQVAAAATIQQARSPISTGAKVRHLPRPSLLNIDDDYLEANAAAGTAPIQASPNPFRSCLTAQNP